MKPKRLIEELRRVFPKEQAEVLIELVKFMDNLVKASDFNELKEIVKEIAKSQKELAEAQKRTEKRVEELAEAQKRTEEELRALIGEHRKTREQLGRLTHTVGYVLEDRAFVGLPKLLKEEFGIEIIQPFIRKIFTLKGGKAFEVNILGKGKKEGREIWIIGEAKTQLKKKDIDEFIKKWPLYESLFSGEKFYLFVTYITSQMVEEYARTKNIKIYYSYQLPI